MYYENKQYQRPVKRQLSTGNFNISVSYHSAHSRIPVHAHNLPYLCLSMSGTYSEISLKTSFIKPGSVVYRKAYYEHANHILNEDCVCLNMEVKNPDLFQNTAAFDTSSFERPININLSKLLISLKNNARTDVIDLQCFESLTTHINGNRSYGLAKWVSQIKDYIQSDPMQNISLEKLSKEVQLHPNYIIRKFKGITGYKLSEYLEKIRLEYAIRELMASGDKIGYIAVDSGFYDQSHMNRVFRKHLQTSPKVFREMLKG